jgi:nitronate monooxygenase
VSRELLDRIGIEHPIVQAPMAGAATVELVVAVSEAGGLGSLACALLEPEEIRAQVEEIRSRTSRPFNLNFFCHELPVSDPARAARWRERLAAYRGELGVGSESPAMPLLEPFDGSTCAVVEELAPPVVSFHFGLPADGLLSRVKSAGCLVLSSATTVAEARWLEQKGCDAIVAQGLEAGGHRGMFLAADPTGQVGTLALVPQVVDAVGVPVVAAGGITDARGIVAALALGASAAQMGTAYLLCPESGISPLSGHSSPSRATTPRG